jgi:hypothetical protein
LSKLTSLRSTENQNKLLKFQLQKLKEENQTLKRDLNQLQHNKNDQEFSLKNKFELRSRTTLNDQAFNHIQSLNLNNPKIRQLIDEILFYK